MQRTHESRGDVSGGPVVAEGHRRAGPLSNHAIALGHANGGVESQRAPGLAAHNGAREGDLVVAEEGQESQCVRRKGESVRSVNRPVDDEGGVDRQGARGRANWHHKRAIGARETAGANADVIHTRALANGEGAVVRAGR